VQRSYLVTYDIREERRLRRVHKVMTGYGEHWQYSVFFCTLSPADRVRLQGELESTMNQREDQVLIFDLGADPDKARRAVAVLGQTLGEALDGMVVL
jgi:CRISPR-associated protein Cas2